MLTEACRAPVIPHAGQMHNHHLAMTVLNCPVSVFFLICDIEVGNDPLYDIFRGYPALQNGVIDLAAAL